MHSIDWAAEKVVPIVHAAEHYPHSPPSLGTVYRHIRQGCRGARLESFVCGGKRYTSVEAIGRFIAATTANSERNGTSSPWAERGEAC
jgi:hypothetical protein